MYELTTILMYSKYSGSFFTILTILFLSDETYYLHLWYFRITWRALTRFNSTILCIVIIFHVVLSHEYFFYARLIFPVQSLRLGHVVYDWGPANVCLHTGRCACISHKRVLSWPQAGVSNPHNQSSWLPRNVAPRDQWCPPTRVDKAPNKLGVFPSSASQNCDWDTLWAMHFVEPLNNRLGRRSQTSTLQKDRDLDHAHTMGRDRTRVWGSTDVLSLYFKQNRHGMSTDQDGDGGVPGFWSSYV